MQTQTLNAIMQTLKSEFFKHFKYELSTKKYGTKH
jgi:hypothetical protein